MVWKPIAEYPKDAERPPLVLARDREKHPYLVIWVARTGHFNICPGVPMFYGEHQFGFMTADSVVEFMEIPV